MTVHTTRTYIGRKGPISFIFFHFGTYIRTYVRVPFTQRQEEYYNCDVRASMYVELSKPRQNNQTDDDDDYDRADRQTDRQTRVLTSYLIFASLASCAK